VVVTDVVDATAIGAGARRTTREPSIQPMIGTTVSSAPVGRLMALSGSRLRCRRGSSEPA
jgi:hypothetical protein